MIKCGWRVYDITDDDEQIFCIEDFCAPCEEPATHVTECPQIPMLCTHHAGVWNRNFMKWQLPATVAQR